MAYTGKRRQNSPKRPWLIGSLTIGLFFLMAATAYTALTSSSGSRATAKPKPAKIVTAPSTTTTAPPSPTCPLTGLPMDRAALNALPLAVVIENHPQARPQSGLGEASVVYEVVAEGGITRFLATFHHKPVSTLGPVRSVREYFADLAHSQGAVIVHCGGSPTGYATVRSLDVPDLDQFANGGSFWRTRDRRAPHNLYTSTDRLVKRGAEKGFSGSLPVELPFKEDLASAQRPKAAWIELDFSSPSYRVRWEFDPSANDYLRFNAGKSHVDAAANRQIRAKNVVVLFTSVRPLDSIGRVRVDLSSGGRALVFRDGGQTEARWSRPAADRMVEVRDAGGAAVELNRGTTWFEVVALGRKVAWQPLAETTTTVSGQTMTEAAETGTGR